MFCHARKLWNSHDERVERGFGSVSLRGAFSYVKRVSQKVGKTEYAAKFVSTRAKKKMSALREMKLLSRLDHDRVLYFHDAFEKKNAVVIVTELYPCECLSCV